MTTTTDIDLRSPEGMRDVRRQLGLTQAQLAAKLGYSRRETVADMERGAEPITARTARLLMLLLHEPRR